MRLTRLSILGCMLSIIVLPSCRRNIELPPIDDYKAFLAVSTEEMCKKMIYCYQPIYRAVSEEGKNTITQANCEKVAMKDIEFKITSNTPQMRVDAKSCYESILNTPCKQFAQVALFDPACMRLKAASKQVFKWTPP